MARRAINKRLKTKGGINFLITRNQYLEKVNKGQIINEFKGWEAIQGSQYINGNGEKRQNYRFNMEYYKTSHQKNVKVEKLVQMINEKHCFCCSYFEYIPLNNGMIDISLEEDEYSSGFSMDDFVSMSAIGIDFDDEEDKTPEEVEKILMDLKIPPIGHYYSFSSTPENPRFRFIIILDVVIENWVEANELLHGIYRVMEEAGLKPDKNCKNPNRMFYPGSSDVKTTPTKMKRNRLRENRINELIEIGKNSYIPPEDRTFFSTERSEGMVPVSVEGLKAKGGPLCFNSIFNGDNSIFNSFSGISMWDTDVNLVFAAAELMSDKDNNNNDVSLYPRLKKELIRLESEGIKFKKGSIKGTIKDYERISKGESYFRRPCSSCAFRKAGLCKYDLNYLLGKGLIYLSDIGTVKLEQSRFEQLPQAFEEAEQSDERIVDIKVETGVGKTRLLLNKAIENDPLLTGIRYVIATPQHRIIEDTFIKNRPNGRCNYVYTLDDEVSDKIQPELMIYGNKFKILLDEGIEGWQAHLMAKDYLYNVIDMKDIKSRFTEEDRFKGKDPINQYFEVSSANSKAVKDGCKNLVTTHKMMELIDLGKTEFLEGKEARIKLIEKHWDGEYKVLEPYKKKFKTKEEAIKHVKNLTIKTIVVYDETPIDNLMEGVTISSRDYIEFFKSRGLSIQLPHAHKWDDESKVYEVGDFHIDEEKRKKLSYIPLKRIEGFMEGSRVIENLNFNLKLDNRFINNKDVMGLYSLLRDKKNFIVKTTYDDDRGRIYHIYGYNKLDNYKTIIMSATPQTELLEILHKTKIKEIKTDKVKWHEGVEVKFITNSIYRNNCGTEDNIEFYKKTLESEFESPEDVVIITYKALEKKFRDEKTFSNRMDHYGASIGINSYEGEDLLLIGQTTKNEGALLPYAILLGKDNLRKKRYLIKEGINKGRKLVTYEDEQLQRLDLLMQQSDLVQAIGRARILGNKSKIVILSNLLVQV